MSIASALYAGIVGESEYTLDNEGTDARQILMDIRASFPSQRAMSTALGIPRSTLQGWIRGTRPNARGFAALQAAQRRFRLSRKREAMLRRGQILIKARIAFSGDMATFKRIPTNWPQIPGGDPHWQPVGMQSRILDAWLRGDDIGAVDALMSVLNAGLNYHAGRDTDKQMGEVYWIRWYPTLKEAEYQRRLRG